MCFGLLITSLSSLENLYETLISIQHFPVTKIISSNPWTIKPKLKPTAAPKRKTVSTAATTAAAAALQPEGTPVTAMGKVDSMVKELRWPFGGGGVTWTEGGGEERNVRGSAVVEREEVTVPRIIFEEIFGLDK